MFCWIKYSQWIIRRTCFVPLKPVLAVSLHVGWKLEMVAKPPELRDGHHCCVGLLAVDRVCCLAGGGGGAVAIHAKGDILSLLNEKSTCAGSTSAAWTGPTFLRQNRCNLEFSGMRYAMGESSQPHISELKS